MAIKMFAGKGIVSVGLVVIPVCRPHGIEWEARL